MSYEKAPTLIARRGYSDLGAMDRTTAATFCGQKFGVQSPDFQPCTDFYASGKPGDYVPKGSSGGGSTGGGTLSQIGTFVGGLLGGLTKIGGTPTQPVIVPQSGTPPWLVPVAIGGIGLVAIMMLRKRRSPSPAPTSNPGRRRRRRRR